MSLLFSFFSFLVPLAQLKHPETSLKHWRLQPGEHHPDQRFLFAFSLLLELFKLQPHTSNFNPKVHSLVQETPNPVVNLFPLLLSLLCLLGQLVSPLMKPPYLLFNLMDLFEQGGLHGSLDQSTQGDRVRGLVRLKERY